MVPTKTNKQTNISRLNKNEGGPAEGKVKTTHADLGAQAVLELSVTSALRFLTAQQR